MFQNLYVLPTSKKNPGKKTKHAHYAQNSQHNHRSKESKLCVKAGSNICLGLSGPTNIPACDRNPWNQIQLISPLNYTLWFSEERDAITQITVVLTQVALISCLRGMHHDRITIALKHHRRLFVIKKKMPDFGKPPLRYILSSLCMFGSTVLSCLSLQKRNFCSCLHQGQREASRHNGSDSLSVGEGS